MLIDKCTIILILFDIYVKNPSWFIKKIFKILKNFEVLEMIKEKNPNFKGLWAKYTNYEILKINDEFYIRPKKDAD